MRKIAFVIILITLGLSIAFAAVPHLINYQGRLTDKDNKPLEGAYSLTFRIYDAETAGNLLWQETQASVVIQKGVFSVLLGAVTNLDLAFDKAYFLEIKVGEEVMSPRQRISSAGYAIRAEHGVPRGVIVMWSGAIADIPAGWALCDGTNGTPDLRNRFIVGAQEDSGGIAKTNVVGSLTQTGGAATKSIAEANLPSHSHSAGTLTGGAHEHTIQILHGLSGGVGLMTGGGETMYPGGPGKVSDSAWMDDTYSPSRWRAKSASAGSVTGSTGAIGSGTALDVLNPYYALAYIMKL